MADGGSFDDAMQRVRARFLTTLAEYLETLDEIGAALDSGRATVDHVVEARHVLHRIAGAAGTLGRTELGAAARACEIETERYLREGMPPLASVASLIAQFCDRLDAEIGAGARDGIAI